jgi:hypothetical protein
LLKCEHCSYEWEYKGRLARASCPSCGQKVKISRRSGVLAAPIIGELPDELDSGEVTTVGQDIDAILGELSQTERERLREILVPQARQLVQLIMLAKGEGNAAK